MKSFWRLLPISGLAVAGLIGVGMALPQMASAALSPAGVSTGSAEAVTPLVTQVKKKFKGRNLKIKKKGRNIHVAPRRRVYVRGWSRRPYYGRVVSGVALGTILGVAIAGTAPRSPSSELCWYWTNPSKNKGYWDYCY